MNEGLTIEERLAAGDVPGALREIRAHRETLPVRELARLVARAAVLAGFDDLAEAGTAVADEPDGENPQALYSFGYACVEHGIGDLATEPLRRALDLVPDAGPILSELVVALGDDGQHARAVEVLERHAPVWEWSHRYQHVYNAIMAGDLGKAERSYDQLSEPSEEALRNARAKVRRMLARAGRARAVTPLDHKDLRGWHYVLTGGILETLSPYGYDDGMTGRWAYTSDSAGSCAEALRRVALILRVAGVTIRRVVALPDRSSRILAVAAAELLGVPLVSFETGDPGAHTLVVAYDLNQVDADTCASLRERAPEQVLFERATCWTDPPAVAADISGLLGQSVVPPWEPRLRVLDDGSVGEAPADDRPEETIGAEIAATPPESDDGDGQTPADPDEVLCRLVQAVAASRDRDGMWLSGVRDYVPDTGPVPSNRFL